MEHYTSFTFKYCLQMLITSFYEILNYYNIKNNVEYIFVPYFQKLFNLKKGLNINSFCFQLSMKLKKINEFFDQIHCYEFL